MSHRLATSLFVSALVRKANAHGGMVTVLRRGDQTAGVLMLLCREQGEIRSLCEPILGPSGTYLWQPVVLPEPVDEEAVTAMIDRRARIDPDLWAVELDIPNAERFIAEFGNHS